MFTVSPSFDPDSDLVFNGSSATLTVSNSNSQGLACKVEAKEADYYMVDPSYFFLLPSKTTAVTLNFDGDVDDDERKEHEFMVSWLPAHEENVPSNAETYWKTTCKARRKEIVTRNFGCEVQEQSLSTDFDMTIVSTINGIEQKGDLDQNIASLGQITVESHSIMVQLNSEFASLIKTIESQNSAELSEIILNLRVIATAYKHLEYETRSAIRQTNNVLEEIIDAIRAKNLESHDKIGLIKRDFTGLSKHFDRLARCHSDISQQLAEQADKAEEAKEANDDRVKHAKEVRKHAKAYGLMGVPGVGFAASVGALASGAADAVDNPALKVLAGTGGALTGVLVGAVLTVGAPIFLAIGAALAIKSQVWAVKFGNMHDSIRKLQGIMDRASQHLTDIVSDLHKLDDDAQNVNEKLSAAMLELALGRVERSCVRVRHKCTQYVRLADSNMKDVKRMNVAKSDAFRLTPK